MEIGTITSGTVTVIMPFGAFVQLSDGKTTGLVHISEINDTYVQKVEDFLKVGDKVQVKILKTDEKGRLSLSIKRAAAETAKKREEKREEKRREKEIRKKNSAQNHRPDNADFYSRRDSGEMTFEDKLTRFKRDSDENMLAIKKSRDSKRSGGYKRGR